MESENLLQMKREESIWDLKEVEKFGKTTLRGVVSQQEAKKNNNCSYFILIITQ